MMARVSSGLSQLSHDDSRLHDAVKAGRETLDEVKSLTEYQDQKETRLLTIITFLSALSSILFARFVASHPLHANFAQSSVGDRKSTRLNSSHYCETRMPSSACKK